MLVWLGLALGAPRLAASQSPQRSRIAWLSMVSQAAGIAFLNPFLEGMAALGYVRGKNLDVDERWGDSSRQALERMAQNAPALERALAAIAAARAEALVVHPDGLMVQQREAIGRFSLQHRIPTISGWATIAEGGSLLTYGPVLPEVYRRLAYFVDRVLRGAKPAELPIEFPTKVELVVNLKTAKALGLTIPPAVLLRADRVLA